MNYLAYQLARNGHLKLKHKVNEIIFRIFGHEARFPVENLATTSHCSLFNIDIIRIYTLSLQQLALRKLFNPFKWLEILLTFPLEILAWSTRRWHVVLHQVLLKADEKPGEHFFYLRLAMLYGLYGIALIIQMLSVPLDLAANIIAGLARRLLAPVRYIIRPILDLIYHQPSLFAATCLLALCFTIWIALSLTTGGLGSVVGGIFLASSLGKLASIGAITAVSLAMFAKIAHTAKEIWQLLVTVVPSAEKQGVCQFISGSTAKVSALLHYLDPETTDIKFKEEQTAGYALALFCGLETLAFPPRMPKTLEETITIAYPKLSDW